MKRFATFSDRKIEEKRANVIAKNTKKAENMQDAHHQKNNPEYLYQAEDISFIQQAMKTAEKWGKKVQLHEPLGVIKRNLEEKNLKASVDQAKADLSSSREGIDESFIGHYDRVRKLVKRAPYVARIESHNCSRCHLRVSNEISRDALNHGEVHFCDQCSCIVYA